MVKTLIFRSDVLNLLMIKKIVEDIGMGEAQGGAGNGVRWGARHFSPRPWYSISHMIKETLRSDLQSQNPGIKKSCTGRDRTLSSVIIRWHTVFHKEHTRIPTKTNYS